MGLSASMWTGVSGLLAHGEKMNVLGNNIANVNTVGFKAARMDFEDFIYQDTSTTAGNFAQLGRGVSVATVLGDFSQGAFETTNETTDLAIGGDGFFMVRPPGQDLEYYTRAGNFRFDNEGYLVDPHGYVLQGKEIRDQYVTPPSGTTTTQASQRVSGFGVPRDIRIPPEGLEARHTHRVNMVTNLENLDVGENDQALTANPFFSLFQSWDPTANSDGEGLQETQYSYQSTIKVYDEAGAAHNLTVYYDPVPISNAGGLRFYEFLVTMDPEDDIRIMQNGYSLNGTSGAGLLMTGVMEFNSSGQLQDLSAYTLSANPTDPKDLTNWVPATFTNGYPVVAANFTGHSNASWANDTDGVASELLDLHGRVAPPIELNFGIANSLGQWDVGTGTTAADVNGDWTQLMSFGPDNTELETLSTTSFASPSSTQFQAQDGYTSGFLQLVSVDRDGILQGRFSNGVTKELWEVQISLFQSETGLRREGGNLFAQTRDSGEAFVGAANTNGRGSISSNALEQSNVDLAREFVNMITTQRGFSANGKVITTTDQMLAEVIMLKR